MSYQLLDKGWLGRPRPAELLSHCLQLRRERLLIDEYVKMLLFLVSLLFCFCLLTKGRRWTFLLRILLRGGLYCSASVLFAKINQGRPGPGPLYQFRCSQRLWIIEAVNVERERRENKD